MHTDRLLSADTQAFMELRKRGLDGDPDNFRTTTADDRDLSQQAWQARLDRDHVVGLYDGGALVGIGGLQFMAGEKLDHKGLIWGMYIREDCRGSGGADAIMTALLDAALPRLRQVQLTVMKENSRAIRFYERHGFEIYGVEPASVRIGGAYKDEALMWRRIG